jgi:hypothetical protein
MALVRDALAQGDLSGALFHSNDLINRFPTAPQGFMLKASAMLARGDVGGSFALLHDTISTFPSNPKLLSWARNLAVQYGRFNAGLRYAEKLTQLIGNDPKNIIYTFFCLMGLKNFDAADRLLPRLESDIDFPELKKMRRYYDQYSNLRAVSPSFVSVWEATLGDQTTEVVEGAPERDFEPLPVIQYWSQGAPPNDVRRVFSHWNALLEREKLGTITLFNRHTADEWIKVNSPEFSGHFSKAFHYAMESDIFRLAYASKKPCVYIDIDCWPLDNTFRILKLGIRSGKSMLYLRSYRPWVLNGLFIARPDCKFFLELIRQCLSLEIDNLPRNRATVEFTFGPSRFNKVIHDILRNENELKVSKVPNVSGCAYLSFGKDRLYFSNEAAIASVRPPFSLDYKTTQDNWKHM